METGRIVQKFIIDNVERHSADIATMLAKKFGFSRQRAHYYLTKAAQNGTLIKTGRTRWTRYFLVGGKYIEFIENIKPGLDEYSIWVKYLKPMLLSYPQNIYRICAYGFTEIFNNAIDHSEGGSIFTDVEISKERITIRIMDNGIGIFRKIQAALKLGSIRESILHLSKGKFTTDPTKHSGEGIFFTSRMFDSFSILSSELYYTFQNEDWMISPEKNEKFGEGTLIKMEIAVDSERTTKEVLDKYSDQEIGFGKTKVAVALSADPNDPHVSRSQAKRLLMGLEKFKTVILDFEGVTSVGQAFVDEVFRVFKSEFPNTEIFYTNANKDVEAMIKRGIANIQ